MIDQLAARTANEINVTTLTKLLGISRVTADDYLDVLTRLSMIVKLRAWTSSESKRDIKQAKYHFADTGIAAALRQMTPATFDFDADPRNEFITYNEPNNANLNDYLRTDCSTTYRFDVSDEIDATIGASIWNIFNKKNIINTYYSLDANNMITKVENQSLGITPNISLRVRF